MNPAFSNRLFISASILFLVSISSLLSWPQVTSGQRLQGDEPSSKFKAGTRTNTTAIRSGTSPLIGSNGDYTVISPDTVLNEYAVLAADALAGTSTITVTDITDLDSPIPGLGPIGTGDLLMIIQMQGATIDTSNTVSYGSVTALNGAGLYEIVYVTSISGNVITINNSSCLSGLRNSYSVAGRTQVVRVPQFLNLTIDPAASVVASPWDGTRGGIVALNAANALDVEGLVSASGAGFRGGAVRSAFSFGETTFRTTFDFAAAEKGEGIAGSASDYDLLLGRYGRGSPANGGGGGNAHNAGGGGGANGDNGNTWTGQGVMTGGSPAWFLDPGYIANGNSLTNSSGGGRGGYTFSDTNLDAVVTGPGDPSWGGLDFRVERGGLGGKPVGNDPATRLFMGGGGGAGESNGTAGGAGGRGGGIVLLISGQITGTGLVRADGDDGQDTIPPHNDAPGGGGAGGTIIVSNSLAFSGVSLSAIGGDGGSQFLTSNEAEGPGGGGGGGYIAVRVGTTSTIADGGASGFTTSNALTEFPENGATEGGTGQANETIVSIPFCVRPTAAEVAIAGRAIGSDGSGLRNATITLTRENGEQSSILTNPFGHFEFEGINAGETVIVSIFHKRAEFSNPVQVVTATSSINEINFVVVK